MSIATDILSGVAATAVVPISGMIVAVLMKLRTKLHLQTTAQDQTNMEAQIEAAIGSGIAQVAKTAPQIIADGITTPKAWQDVLDGATAYFKQRFPDRAAAIDAATPDTMTLDAAVQQTIAARLPNVNPAIALGATAGQAASVPAT